MMTKTVNILLVLYFIGSFAIMKWGSETMHNNYMLGSLIVFTLLVTVRLLYVLNQAAYNKKREDIAVAASSLFVLAGCFAIYFLI